MKTIKLKISYCSDNHFIKEKMINYSYAFRKMYKNFNDIDSNLIFLKDKYNLNDIEFRSIKSEVKSKIDKTKKSKEKLEEDIIQVSNELNKLKEKRTKKDNRLIYKLNNKLSHYNKNLPKDIVFGGRKILSNISKYNNIIKNYSKTKYSKSIDYYENLLITNKKEFKNRRIMPFFIMGEANQKGNRFFDFTFEENKVIYKPFKGKKIEFKLHIPRNYKDELFKLSEMVENKEIAVSVSICNNYFRIIFDDEKLNGYAIDEISRKKEIDLVKKNHINKEIINLEIKQIYKKYYIEQENKKKKGKIENRCLSIDLNPNFIGCSILDKLDDGEIKLVKAFDYNLTELNKKLPKEATPTERKKLNNLRKHTISNIIKSIIYEMLYYKCYSIVIEDLNFKKEFKKSNSKEANRQTKNVWHRSLVDNLITKYCNKFGFNKILINPAYSSFIGNIKYKYVDWVNASIEIGRRGLYKYDKGNFYPKITNDDINTAISLMKSVDLEFSHKVIKNWNSFYNIVIDSGLRYRRDLSIIDDIEKYYKLNKSYKHKYGNVNSTIYI